MTPSDFLCCLGGLIGVSFVVTYFLVLLGAEKLVSSPRNVWGRRHGAHKRGSGESGASSPRESLSRTPSSSQGQRTALAMAQDTPNHPLLRPPSPPLLGGSGVGPRPRGKVHGLRWGLCLHPGPCACAGWFSAAPRARLCPLRAGRGRCHRRFSGHGLRVHARSNTRGLNQGARQRQRPKGPLGAEWAASSL